MIRLSKTREQDRTIMQRTRKVEKLIGDIENGSYIYEGIFESPQKLLEQIGECDESSAYRDSLNRLKLQIA
jgi:hypothetical protein